MLISESTGSGVAGRNASHVPSTADSLRRLMLSSASISSSVARRSSRSCPLSVSVMASSAAAASILWSKIAKNTGCKWSESCWGLRSTKVGGGVSNVNRTASASSLPACDFVPAGISTTCEVAIGRRSSTSGSCSKRSVRVPIHCQRPGSAGVIAAGTSRASSWLRVASGTIGWLKVMLTKGAIPTSPLGWTLKTSNGPGSTDGACESGPAGNGCSTVAPVRGGRSDSGGRLNSALPSSTSPLSHGGSRSITVRISASSSGLPST